MRVRDSTVIKTFPTRAGNRSGRAAFHRAAAVARASTPTAAEPMQSEAVLLPADLIGGDESIIFAIKPSVWFIFFDSARWLIVGLVAVTCASWLTELIVPLSEAQFLSAVLSVVGVRVVVALLRWVSRSYVLTNRRVMRIRGVLKTDVFDCPLVHIRNTAVTVSFHEALSGLGTLNFVLSQRADQRSAWRNIAHAGEIHAEVRKAIERAMDCQPHI